MILKEYDLSVRLPQEKAIDTGITLVQNDKDVYKLNIRIFDGVNEIDYTNVDSATITFSKGDGNVVQGDMTVGADSLTYTMGTNEIAHPGTVQTSVQLFGASGERLTSARFRFDVVKDLITPSAVKSTSEFSILQRVKQDVDDIVPLLPDIEQVVQDFSDIQDFFDTAEVSEAARIANEATRQTQETARQASIADIEDRFEELTAQQQQDAEVIDARDGETSLNARLNRDHAEFTSHMADIAPHPDAQTLVASRDIIHGNMHNIFTFDETSTRIGDIDAGKQLKIKLKMRAHRSTNIFDVKYVAGYTGQESYARHGYIHKVIGFCLNNAQSIVNLNESVIFSTLDGADVVVESVGANHEVFLIIKNTAQIVSRWSVTVDITTNRGKIEVVSVTLEDIPAE